MGKRIRWGGRQGRTEGGAEGPEKGVNPGAAR